MCRVGPAPPLPLKPQIDGTSPLIDTDFTDERPSVSNSRSLTERSSWRLIGDAGQQGLVARISPTQGEEFNSPVRQIDLGTHQAMGP